MISCIQAGAVSILLFLWLSYPAFAQEGEPFIHAAARQGYTQLIELLIEDGTDVNFISERGETPLHAAAKNGRMKAVRMLIKNGAEINATNLFSETPADVAEKQNFGEITDFLRERGARPGQ